MNNEKMFREESVWKVLIKTSIPTIITMFVVILYNMADIFFIGKTGDAMQVAALSLTTPIFTLMSAFGTLVGSGGCSAIAIAMGKKEEKTVKSMSSFCCYSALIIGTVFAVVVLLMMNPILRLLGTNEATYTFAKTYMMILVLGAPATIFSSACGNMVRAEGAVKVSMFGNLTGSLVNIALDPLLILGLHMGVAGAAIATVIGNLISCLFYLVYILKKSTCLSLHIKNFSIRKEISVPVLTLGFPTTIGVLLSSLSSALSNNILVGYGEVAVAAMGVAGKLSMIVTMLQMAICTGIQPVLAYNFGAGSMKRMMEFIKKTGIVTILTGLLLTIISFIIRSAFISGFINDPEVIAYGERMVMGTMVTGPFIGIYYLTTNFLQATAKPSFASLMSLLRQGLIFIPMLFILSRFAGLNGIIFAHPVSDLLSTAVGIGLCIIHYRKITS